MQDRTYGFATPAGAAFGNDRIRQDVDLVTARLNYRFGGPVDREVLISRASSDKVEAPGSARGFFVGASG